MTAAADGDGPPEGPSVTTDAALVNHVTKYDDIAPAATASLTTVWQPHAAKGEEAVRLLGEGGDDVVLPTELVVRASSGPAPS